MKKYLYIITNISMPGICKVGITNNVEKRLVSLNGSTSLPTRFQIYEVFILEDKAQLMEQLVLQTFADKRINMRREFLEIYPEVLCEFVKKHKRRLKEETLDTGLFSKLGITKGSTLYFIDGGRIDKTKTAKVGKGRNIIYKGKSLAMSVAALSILNKFFGKKWKAAQGSIYWSYNGKTIRELMDEKGLK